MEYVAHLPAKTPQDVRTLRRPDMHMYASDGVHFMSMPHDAVPQKYSAGMMVDVLHSQTFAQDPRAIDLYSAPGEQTTNNLMRLNSYGQQAPQQLARHAAHPLQHAMPETSGSTRSTHAQMQPDLLEKLSTQVDNEQRLPVAEQQKRSSDIHMEQMGYAMAHAYRTQASRQDASGRALGARATSGRASPVASSASASRSGIVGHGEWQEQGGARMEGWSAAVRGEIVSAMQQREAAREQAEVHLQTR